MKRQYIWFQRYYILCMTYGLKDISKNVINHLNLTLIYIYNIYNSVRTSKRTSNFATTRINWLMLFKEIIAVYIQNYTKPTNTKYIVAAY
jgi:hypothetical protein